MKTTLHCLEIILANEGIWRGKLILCAPCATFFDEKHLVETVLEDKLIGVECDACEAYATGYKTVEDLGQALREVHEKRKKGGV